MPNTENLAVRTQNEVAGQVQIISKIQDLIQYLFCCVEISFSLAVDQIRMMGKRDKAHRMFGRDYKCWLENMMARKIAHRWEGNIKMDHKAVRWVSAQDRGLVANTHYSEPSCSIK